ncbi:endonuclease/exonuclease/phosphatase family protein [Pelagibius sp. Alg239-R121]|uniref:endonuclease/exonuclease/phosphatase family protein n=1 Tax=Pelagibius sp. Alg239-R121 TaxID=2993448 RepID=UPI0024A66B36|nr:endonuclease/exonuclease/phosphatase family protein [Pelagibius sp. Alg239-R121]
MNDQQQVSRLKSVFLTLVTRGAGLAAAALAFGFFAPWLPVADSFAHFRFHLILALAIAAVALVLLRAPVRAMLAAALIMPGISGLAPALPAATSVLDPKADTDFTLVQLNLNFRNRTAKEAVRLIRESDADVVTLQEVSFFVWQTVSDLNQDYPYSVVCQFRRVGAVAVFSRLPFPTGLGPVRGCIIGEGLSWIRVEVGDRTVTVASIHLHWPFPFGQAAQVERLEGHLQALPRPVVIGGDFNAAPWSHSVNRIGEAADASVVEGLRLTIYRPSLRWAPGLGLPIDHILVGPELAAVSAVRGPAVGSDHLPVIARLGFVP